MSPLTRRVLVGVGAGVGAALIFTAGVVTGVVGSRAGHESADAQTHSTPAASSKGPIDEAADRIEHSAIRPVSRGTLQRAAVEGMLKALGDRWSVYYEPSQYASFKQALDGHFVGIGLWLRPGPAGPPAAGAGSGTTMVVGSVQPGSPAQRAGIVAGDVLLTVDGKAVAGHSVEQVAGWLRGGAEAEESDGLVTLVVQGLSGTRTVSVQRTAFPSSDVSISHLTGGVLVIHITAFSQGTGRQVRDALSQAASQDAFQKGVVLDLRGNPGGLLTEGVEVASAFLDGGPVVTYEGRTGGPHTLDAVGKGNTTVPLVVLVDHQTASAAEVVAGALQDRGRAVIVGSRTFGKGSVQEPSTLSDGSALELTVARYRTPSGRSLEGVGVEPDVEVSADSEPQVAEQRALDVLSGLVAALNPIGRG